MNLIKRMMLLTPLFLLTSCLTLSMELDILSSRSYMITLDYSVRSDFARIKYLANNRSVLTLPLTEQEYLDFVSTKEGIIFLNSQFSRTEQGGRIIIHAELTMENISVLEDLLSCRVLLEGESPYELTLSYDRGGEPSEEAVTYINGYCAGEMVNLSLRGPGGELISGEWSLRELLLEPEAPSLQIEWEE